MYDYKGKITIGISFEGLNDFLTQNALNDEQININDFLKITELEAMPEHKYVQFNCEIFSHLPN